ncbi:MAG: hypothetical protein HYZ81_07160 [Nitrospinae bacterium]|nr:hypothetical protein [Nitrospinota bacterium]
MACWPFAPERLELLEDHILMAEAAQETRDLIRILAQAYRARGEEVALMTPADFFVDDDACGVQSLLDSIATLGEQERLREVAQQNLDTVRAVGAPVAHARELVSALWMRSMSPGRRAGGTRQDLHLDITRDTSVDDNSFQGELVQLIENSINIHGEETPEGRLYFALPENPRSKVRSTAKNDRLWHPAANAAGAGQMVYPGKDIEHIRHTLKHMLVPETQQPVSRVIILGPSWQTDPWSEVEDLDKPNRWDRPVLVAIPEPLDIHGGNRVRGLGEWLAAHVPQKRNTVRFLLPVAGTKGMYSDADLAFAARCSYLTSIAWRDDLRYQAIRGDFDRPLRDSLKQRFDRFAVLQAWNYRSPEECTFEMERVGAQGEGIPTAVEEKLLTDLFDPAAFEALVLEEARESRLMGDLLDELAEPPPSNAGDAIPFLGDTGIYEEVLKIVAQGKIVLNVGGTWVGRLHEYESDDQALRHVRSRAFRTGQELRQVQLGLPAAVGGTTVAGPGPRPPDVTSGPTVVAPTPEGVPTPEAPGPVVIPPREGDGSIPVAPSVPEGTQTRQTDEPNTGINLSGFFERWGISSGTILSHTKLEFEGLTVQQIKQILQRLPSSVKARLEVSYPKEDDQS